MLICLKLTQRKKGAYVCVYVCALFISLCFYCFFFIVSKSKIQNKKDENDKDEMDIDIDQDLEDDLVN